MSAASFNKGCLLGQVLFAYDGGFRRSPRGVIYSGGGFPASIWSRYLDFSRRVRVAARLKDTEMTKGLTLSSAPGVEFFSVPSISTPKRAVFDRREARQRLGEAMEECDFVIVRLPSEIGLLAFKEAKAAGKFVAVELVGHPFDALWNHGSRFLKIYAPLLNARVRNAVEKADACIYVTKDFLQGEFPCGGLIGSASNVEVQVAEWCEIEPIVRSRRRQCPVKVGLIGSMVSNYKGVDIAIHAIAYLHSRGIPAELRVLGNGDSSRYKSIARKLGVSGHIYFDGTRPAGAAVQSWLDRLDIYIQPSRTEGLPRALVEAMARGLVCFGSRAGGIPELLSDRSTFEIGDSKRLAHLIRESVRMDQCVYIEHSKSAHGVAAYYDQRLNDSRRSEFWARVVRQVTGSKSSSD